MSSRKLGLKIAVLLILFAALLVFGWWGHLAVQNHQLMRGSADDRLQAAALRNIRQLDHAAFRPREYVKIVRTSE